MMIDGVTTTTAALPRLRVRWDLLRPRSGDHPCLTPTLVFEHLNDVTAGACNSGFARGIWTLRWLADGPAATNYKQLPRDQPDKTSRPPASKATSRAHFSSLPKLSCARSPLAERDDEIEGPIGAERSYVRTGPTGARWRTPGNVAQHLGRGHRRIHADREGQSTRTYCGIGTRTAAP